MSVGSAIRSHCVTLRPSLSRVRAPTDTALSCQRVWHIPPVWHTVPRHARWPDSLVTPGFLPSMESPLRFW